jgi:type IV secretory pathway VirB3-like protein
MPGGKCPCYILSSNWHTVYWTPLKCKISLLNFYFYILKIIHLIFNSKIYAYIYIYMYLLNLLSGCNRDTHFVGVPVTSMSQTCNSDIKTWKMKLTMPKFKIFNSRGSHQIFIFHKYHIEIFSQIWARM